MKNYTLVIVSSRTLVVREFSGLAMAREIAGCTGMMRQTLVLEKDSVIFEHVRATDRVYLGEGEDLALIKTILREGKKIRALTERENRAIEKVRYRA